MSEDTTNKATAQIISLLTKIAGVSTGFFIIGVLCGWKMQSAYFDTLGASWVLDSLSPAFAFKKFSSYLLTFVFFSLLSSVFYLMDFNSIKSLRRISIVTLLLGTVLYVISEIILEAYGIFDASYQIKHALIGTGVVCVAVSSGYTVGEVLARLNERGLVWEGYYSFQFFIIFLTFIHQAPAWIGISQARLDASYEESMLPYVSIHKGQVQDDFRLIYYSDEVFLVMKIEENSIREFLILNIDEVLSIKK